MTAYRKPVRLVIQRAGWAKASWRYYSAEKANAVLNALAGVSPEPEGGPVVRCDVAVRVGDEWRRLESVDAVLLPRSVTVV